MSADATLRNFVERCAAALPGRILSACLRGSATDGTELATSDLDGVIIFRDKLTVAERARIAELLDDYGRGIAIEPDVDLADEAAAMRGVSPMLKEAGRFVWGEEIRDRLPIVPLIDWTRDRLHSSYWRAVKLLGRATPVRLPLAYPAPADEFSGYCRHAVRLPDGTVVPSTRDLIRARTLGFANHFLGIYRAFLLAELRGGDEAGRAFALRVLADIPMDDAEIAALVQAQGMASGNAVGST